MGFAWGEDGQHEAPAMERTVQVAESRRPV